MDEFAEVSARESEARRIARRQWFWLHLAVYITSQIFIVVIWALSDNPEPWYIFPLLGWGILIAAHAVFAFVVKTPEEIMMKLERDHSEDPR
jgi:hypothetical protein